MQTQLAALRKHWQEAVSQSQLLLRVTGDRLPLRIAIRRRLQACAREVRDSALDLEQARFQADIACYGTLPPDWPHR